MTMNHQGIIFIVINSIALIIMVGLGWPTPVQTEWIVDQTPYTALLGSVASLPCNLTPPTFDDSVALLLWYREDIANPIYTIDARTTELGIAKHFINQHILGGRAIFNLSYPVGVLELNPVFREDAGEYRCRTDFRRARTINRILRLDVIVPITQITVADHFGHIINGNIAGPYNEGSTVNFTCSANGGNPHPWIEWWRGSELIQQSSGQGSNTLSIEQLTRGDLMTILTCQALNTNLTAPIAHTFAIDLNLKPKEVRIISPAELQGRNLSIGDRYEFVCQASGSRPAVSLQWRREPRPGGIGGGGQSVILEHSGETTSNDGTVTTSYLSFVPSIEDDGQTLVCSGRNPAIPDFELVDRVPISVSYAPLLSLVMGSSSRQTNDQITEHSDVYFECNARSNPLISDYGWLFEGELLTTDSELGIFVNNMSLTIKNVDPRHAGRYQCFASNSEGRGESDTVTLKVKYSPVCKSNHQAPVGVAIGEEVRIHCVVDADPPEVQFEWLLNGSSLTSPMRPMNDRITIMNEALESILAFRPQIPTDYGLFECRGANRVGRQMKACSFLTAPAGPPDPPTNCSITNTTAHALIVECAPGYSGGSSLDQIFHLEMYDANSRTLIRNITAQEYPFFLAHGLPVATSFLLLVYASNSRGRSKTVTITGSTVLAAKLSSDADDEIVISPLLATLIGAVGALFFLTIIIILVMKLKSSANEEDSSKHGSSLTSSSSPSNGLRTKNTTTIDDDDTDQDYGVKFRSSSMTSTPSKNRNNSKVYFDSKVETCTYRAASPHVSTLGPDVTINRSSLLKTGSPCEGLGSGTLLNASPHLSAGGGVATYATDLSHHLYHHHHLHFGSQIDPIHPHDSNSRVSLHHHEAGSSIENLNHHETIHNTPKSRASIVSVRSIDSLGRGTASSSTPLPIGQSSLADNANNTNRGGAENGSLAQIVVLCACDPENIIAVPLVEEDKGLDSDTQKHDNSMLNESSTQNQIRPIIIYEKDPSPVSRLSGCFEDEAQTVQFVTHELCYNQPECQIKVQSQSGGQMINHVQSSMDQCSNSPDHDYAPRLTTMDGMNGGGVTPITRQSHHHSPSSTLQTRYAYYQQNGKSPNSTLVRNEKKWVIIDHVDNSQPKTSV